MNSRLSVRVDCGNDLGVIYSGDDQLSDLKLTSYDREESHFQFSTVTSFVVQLV